MELKITDTEKDIASCHTTFVLQLATMDKFTITQLFIITYFGCLQHNKKNGAEKSVLNCQFDK